jgi:hypothetical protein
MAQVTIVWLMPPRDCCHMVMQSSLATDSELALSSSAAIPCAQSALLTSCEAARVLGKPFRFQARIPMA